jgi:hypothetical protein
MLARIKDDGGFEFCRIHGTIFTWSLLLRSNSLSGFLCWLVLQRNLQRKIGNDGLPYSSQ